MWLAFVVRASCLKQRGLERGGAPPPKSTHLRTYLSRARGLRAVKASSWSPLALVPVLSVRQQRVLRFLCGFPRVHPAPHGPSSFMVSISSKDLLSSCASPVVFLPSSSHPSLNLILVATPGRGDQGGTRRGSGRVEGDVRRPGVGRGGVGIAPALPGVGRVLLRRPRAGERCERETFRLHNVL
jgi:hypothetical protein